MAFQANRRALSLWLGDERRAIWGYRTDAHFFDQIAAPGFFAPVADWLTPGDLILVDCPGYVEVERPFGRRALYTHRAGGGLLQVSALDPADGPLTLVLAEGLKRFPSAPAHAIPPHAPRSPCTAGSALSLGRATRSEITMGER